MPTSFSRNHINIESVMFLKALSIKDHLKKKYFQNQKNENETDNLNSNQTETNQNNPKKVIQRSPLNHF